MAIYDVNGKTLATGGSATVTDAASWMLCPFPVLRTASALKTSNCSIKMDGSTVILTGDATGYAAFEIPVDEVESQMVRFMRTSCWATPADAASTRPVSAERTAGYMWMCARTRAGGRGEHRWKRSSPPSSAVL